MRRRRARSSSLAAASAPSRQRVFGNVIRSAPWRVTRLEESLKGGRLRQLFRRITGKETPSDVAACHLTPHAASCFGATIRARCGSAGWCGLDAEQRVAWLAECVAEGVRADLGQGGCLVRVRRLLVSDAPRPSADSKRLRPHLVGSLALTRAVVKNIDDRDSGGDHQPAVVPVEVLLFRNFNSCAIDALACQEDTFSVLFAQPATGDRESSRHRAFADWVQKIVWTIPDGPASGPDGGASSTSSPAGASSSWDVGAVSEYHLLELMGSSPSATAAAATMCAATWGPTTLVCPWDRFAETRRHGDRAASTCWMANGSVDCGDEATAPIETPEAMGRHSRPTAPLVAMSPGAQRSWLRQQLLMPTWPQDYRRPPGSKQGDDVAPEHTPALGRVRAWQWCWSTGGDDEAPADIAVTTKLRSALLRGAPTSFGNTVGPRPLPPRSLQEEPNGGWHRAAFEHLAPLF